MMIEKASPKITYDHSQDRASQYIQWIMNAHIHLCIANKKCPEKDQADPFSKLRTKGEKNKHRHGEMIGRMGRSETGAHGTILDQESYGKFQGRITAGSGTKN